MTNSNDIELIDCDGVIRDFVKILNKVYNREYPDNQFHGKITEYNLSKVYPIGEDIGKFYSELFAEEIYTQAEVFPGALKFLNELVKYKKIYIFTTQPNKKVEEYTEYWLNKNNIPYDSLIFTKDKRLVKGQYLLDDYTKNLERVSEAKSSIPICFNQDYNQDWKGPRVYNYNKFLEIIKNDKITTQSELETFLLNNNL
jgi:5'(3')-deoxyribonucleotidase